MSKNYISVCKNVIAQNNKSNWVNPQPAIRIAKTKSGKAIDRANIVGIRDKNGNIVARIISTTDGKPVIKAGAKVIIETNYDVEVIE